MEYRDRLEMKCRATAHTLSCVSPVNGCDVTACQHAGDLYTLLWRPHAVGGVIREGFHESQLFIAPYL